jgi:hypothetical protein
MEQFPTGLSNGSSVPQNTPPQQLMMENQMGVAPPQQGAHAIGFSMNPQNTAMVNMTAQPQPSRSLASIVSPQRALSPEPMQGAPVVTQTYNSAPVQEHQTPGSPGRGRAAPTTRSLNIYSNGGHYVQNASGINMIPLPETADLSTVIVLDDRKNVVPFTYIPVSNLRDTLTLFEKDQIIVNKGNATYTGKVLSIGDNTITLMQDGKLTKIVGYDSLTAQIPYDLSRSHIHLQTTQPVTVSYLIDQISWDCQGTALINEQTETISLRLAALIQNETGSILKGTVRLIAGNIYKPAQYHMMRSQSMMSSAAQSLAPLEEKQADTALLEDYTAYSAGTMVIEKKALAELAIYNFPAQKIYINEIGERQVRYGYRFRAPDFLPHCTVNAYASAGAGRAGDSPIGAYLGGSVLRESQKGEERDLLIGESGRVRCETKLEIEERTLDNETLTHLNLKESPSGDKLMIVSFGMTIINSTDKEALVLIRYRIGNRYLAALNCGAIKMERKVGYLQWYLQVPARRGETEGRIPFACMLQII